jgi:drug/metabolite transporter (DMT)-like permease
LIAIAISLALSIALGNSSLISVSLSLTQIIKAMLPIFSCGLSILVEGKKPSEKEAVALIILASGVSVAVWQGALNGSPLGIAMCIASTAFNALNAACSSRVLKKVGTGRLTFVTAPMAAMFLLPLASKFEIAAFHEYCRENPVSAALIIGSTSCLAAIYNFVYAVMLKQLGAVTCSVVGEVKIIVLIALSGLVLKEAKQFTATQILGCAVALVGLSMYSSSKTELLTRKKK